MLDLDYEVDARDTFDSLRDGQRHARDQRYKPRRSNKRGGNRPTLLELPICAIDGEGKTPPGLVQHYYTVMCASWPNGRKRIRAESLTFEQCMDFLLSLPSEHCYVIYGGSYDTNMMLKYLPHYEQDRLLDKGKVSYHGYRLRWIERKFFTVARSGQTRCIYDVLANFQVPFVRLTPLGKGACESWNIGTDDELAIVRRMKEQRGNFATVDDDAIEDYCYLECDLLRKLCRAFFDAILQTPYRPRAVYGPGALAAAAMEKHQIQKYMTVLDDELELLSRTAYFGGRFDTSVLGWFSDVWQYDIRSAYPDQIRNLPCLKHATWREYTYADYHERGIPQWGIFRAEWEVCDTAEWTPFPHRDRKGCIWYPFKGAGWYHAEEIRAAMEMYPDQITFDRGWELVRGCEHQPFGFVDALYEQRKSMPPDQGVVIKLVLNSLYGKTAQQVGSHYGKRPTFQCFFWAGAITAGTRAKLLRAIRQSPSAVFGVATDGIVCARALDLDIGIQLGQWEAKRLASYAQISNGVYKAVDDKGSDVERARGFGRANLDWQRVRRDYLKSRGVGATEFWAKARFITIREARVRTDRDAIACTWLTQKRVLNFWPSRRFPGKYDKSGPTLTLEPVEPPDTFESQPFRLKHGQAVHDARERFNPSATAWLVYV